MFAGKVAFEGFGAYCVTKHAIEAYSDVLRMEMKKWEVKVSVIEPAGYKTGKPSLLIIQLTNEAILRPYTFLYHSLINRPFYTNQIYLHNPYKLWQRGILQLVKSKWNMRFLK